VFVVAGTEQLPGDRVVLLLAQRGDPYALRLQQLLRLAVASLGQHPHLPLVLLHRLDPHQLVVLKIQEVVPYELVVLVVRAGQLPELVGRDPLEGPQRFKQFPASRPGRSPPVLGTTCYIYMRVVGPATPLCPPFLTCGNARFLATGRGGGDGGVHGGASPVRCGPQESLAVLAAGDVFDLRADTCSVDVASPGFIGDSAFEHSLLGD
jgi:hypothetical protein